jgi:hypothetical protein
VWWCGGAVIKGEIDWRLSPSKGDGSDLPHTPLTRRGGRQAAAVIFFLQQMLFITIIIKPTRLITLSKGYFTGRLCNLYAAFARQENITISILIKHISDGDYYITVRTVVKIIVEHIAHDHMIIYLPLL